MRTMLLLCAVAVTMAACGGPAAPSDTTAATTANESPTESVSEPSADDDASSSEGASDAATDAEDSAEDSAAAQGGEDPTAGLPCPAEPACGG